MVELDAGVPPTLPSGSDFLFCYSVVEGKRYVMMLLVYGYPVRGIGFCSLSSLYQVRHHS